MAAAAAVAMAPADSVISQLCLTLAVGAAVGLAAAAAARALRVLLSWARLARLLDARFPGPPAWPVIGNSVEVGLDFRYMMDNLLRLVEPFYPTGRGYIGPLPLVALGDPRDVEAVIGSLQHVQKPFLYSFMEPWLGTGLITSPKHIWRPHRRLLEPAFHSRLLAEFAPVFSRQTDTFLEGLARHADGPAFDIMRPIDLLTLDVLCETAMGVRLDIQRDGEGEFVRALKLLEATVLERGAAPWLYPDWLFHLTPLGRRWRRALAVVHGTRDRVVQQRKRQLQQEAGAEAGAEAETGAGRRRMAFLDLLLKNSGFSEADVAHEVDTFLVAGHDTTAYALAVAAHLLAANPAAQERAAEEVEAVFGRDRAPDPAPEHLARLDYLDRAIKETLRLYPPVMILLRKTGCAVKLVTSDREIPADCMVMVSPYNTQRRPELFPDPERFDPDRWLPENSRDRHPYSYFPFSAGPRNCIGRRYAQLEMKTVLAKLLWRFRLEPEPGFELKPAWGLIGILMTGSRLRLTERRRPAPQLGDSVAS